MATDLLAMTDALNIELGGSFNVPKLAEYLKHGVSVFNARAARAFSLADDTTLDRDATELEKRLLVLCAVIGYLDGRMIAESLNAFKVRSPAGATDLTGIEFALAKRRKELTDPEQGEVPYLFDRLNASAIEGEIETKELGETRDLTLVTTLQVSFPPWYWYW